MNNFINGTNNTFDLFITNSDCDLNANETLDPFHQLINITQQRSYILILIKTLDYEYNFNKGNYEKINTRLNNINWIEIKNQSNDVNQFFNILYQQLYKNIYLK